MSDLPKDWVLLLSAAHPVSHCIKYLLFMLTNMHVRQRLRVVVAQHTRRRARVCVLQH